MSEEQLIALLDAETWLTAEDAVRYGFADEIEATRQLAASLDGKFLKLNGQAFDLSRYRNPPELEGVVNEGRTLSAANEQRISQARDLLSEVLDQLSNTGQNQNDTSSGQESLGLTPLYLAQIQINQNKRGLPA